MLLPREPARQARHELLNGALDPAEVVRLHVDRPEGTAFTHRAHLERQDEVARLLAESERLVEGERVRIRVEEEMCRPASAEVLDHGVDERPPGSLTPAGIGDEEVADPREVILEPGGDEADRLAVLLGEEERVRVERLLELRAVGLPADVRPWGRRCALGLPALPQPLQGVEVVGGRVADRHAGGKRRRPVRR